MKRVGQFAVVLAAVASFFAWGTEGFAAEPIRIGYMATLTGEGATWGQHEREGALMAVKDINARGGVLGRPLELICYDVKGKPEEGVSAIRRLIYDDKVVAIGGSNYSGIQIAVAPIADKGQVPVVSSTATNPAVTVDPDTGKVRPYMPAWAVPTTWRLRRAAASCPAVWTPPLSIRPSASSGPHRDRKSVV